MNGYKGMLRDRMPLILDLALRWCKAKDRWIDYVYDSYIKKQAKDKRSIAVKTILGIKQKWKRQEIYDRIKYSELKPITKEQVDKIPKSALFLTFNDTIEWEKLSKEEPDMYEYWKIVGEWVNWFSCSHLKIENTYKHSRQWGMSEDEIVPIIMSKYSIDNKLAKYLIKSFK